MDAESEKTRMAGQEISLRIIAGAWGDVQSRALHYEQLSGYHQDAAGIARNMQAELAKITEARRGMVPVEIRLNSLRGQIDCNQIGSVIEPVWIDTLKEMLELMTDLLDRRTRIKAATEELTALSQALAHKQHIINDWYTEATPGDPAT